MKKVLLLFLGIIFIVPNIIGQKEAYVIYNAKGKKVSYKKMMKKLAKKDVLLFGELHDNPIAHWLQFEVTSELNEKRDLILGAEMLEADDQDHVTKYVKGEITNEDLDSLARLWPNYKTDYKPLVDFAKDNGIHFVATNIPRRFASLVYKKGFEALDTLSAEEKSWIAPLPFPFDSELPRYKNILVEFGDHASPELVKAQASKDATMAHFILENYKDGSLFIHYNGAYHSDYYEGILWYLRGQKEDLDYATISTVTQKDIRDLEKKFEGKADFIICVDEDMTRTY